jgi:predicted transcriptional regulator
MSRVNKDHEEIYAALEIHGPCTTRQLAHAMNRDILNVRPRVTELFQIGMAEVVGGTTEGIYKAVSQFTAQHAFAEKQRKSIEPQLNLF